MTVTQISYESVAIDISGEGLQTKGEFKKDDKTVNIKEDKILKELLETGVLCNNAVLPQGETETEPKSIGEPLEVALLVAGAKAGIKRDSLVEEIPEVREEAFEPEVKMMATFHKDNGGYKVAVKGAPEKILDSCSHFLSAKGKERMRDSARKHWIDISEKMAEDGLRTLALATKITKNKDDNPYEDLTFLGIAGFLDPPREEVRQSIEECNSAGVKVIMVTGDQAVTARKVGAAVGLVDDGKVMHGKELENIENASKDKQEKVLRTNIFARVTPKQKLNLITLYQKNNSVVAMTGDGVNDAPALKKADIGIAMGQRGTQVAQEVADMVLKDDSFSTIVIAIRQGRIIFNNIRKFIAYLLPCHVSEIAAVTLASLVNAPLPILPLQILFLNIVTDVFPALAVGVGEGSPEVMNQKPRDPGEAILTKSHWTFIIIHGCIMAIPVLCALALALGWLKMEKQQAVTVSFLTLGIVSLLHVFNVRSRGSKFLGSDIIRNPFVWAALGLGIGLLLIAVYLPGLNTVLKVSNPGLKGWGLVICISMIQLTIVQVIQTIRKGGV